MRPRVFPAEDPPTLMEQAIATAASMRPRVFPAEDRNDRIPRGAPCAGFNEAAGIPRGRRCHDIVLE